MNLSRRHMDESQRAMVGARIAQLKKGSNQHACIQAPTQSDTAKMMKVGRTTVQEARKVLDTGVGELVAAVDGGKMAVSVANAPP